MGCFELSGLFPKGHSDKRFEERNNASSSGECSTKGGTGTNSGTNSGSYGPNSGVNSGSYAHNSGTNSNTNSGSYFASDPSINVEVVVDPAVATDGVVIDAPGTKLSQSGSLRKPNDLRDFTYQELRYATKNFDRKNLLGEGGFGQVFKGTIKQKQRFGGGEEKVDVAVKQLNSRSQQGHKEWLAEVHFLGLVDCAFLVKLIGYCATDDDERGLQRLLVYEFMPNKGLDDHLFRQGPNCLSWASRVKIVLGAARGLAYLHEELEIQIIFRDFKTSNVLLDEDFNPKLSDFGLARQGPQDGDSHVSTAVVGTAGYAAPEYIQTGHLTVKSDVWSFGIVMLEVLTGRKVMDRNRPKNEQRLVEWAKPYINDHHKIFQIVDPLLKGRYPARPAQKFAQLAYQCLSKFPKHRPKMSDIVEKLKIVQEKTYQWENPSSHSPTSLSLSGEISRSSKDSPRGLTLGSLPTVRSGKASKYSPSVRNSGDDSRQIPNLSLEGSSHGSSHLTKRVSTPGTEPKPVESTAEKPVLVATAVEEPNPLIVSAGKPELVAPVLEEPKPVEPKSVDSTEKPELVATVVEEPKSMDTIAEKPKPTDFTVEKAEPLNLSAEKPELLGTAESPEPVDISAEILNPVDTPAEKPDLVKTFVEEPKILESVVAEPKLVETVVEEPKLVDTPKPMDTVAEELKLGNTVVEEPKTVDLSKENSPSEVVKRRSWGSDRLSRMSRESGRFTWIPKLSFSTSSNRSTS
ncbi:hypothetical protein KC19_6G108200 [Ceratodon purpureus]|uniref:non-specific serine/threonine protein kinase n=1 Tax=Ceratodon purpureus TaxID=3225 RepID=A0A8T0HEH3_CERPU|nr:hypothetical protein KC19_6G108200 [Ceratodon purpureus]